MNDTIKRIAEIAQYITTLIEVKKNINRTFVKFELYDSANEAITLTFNDPFFEVEMKQKFINDYVDRAIDYFQKEYTQLKTIQL